MLVLSSLRAGQPWCVLASRATSSQLAKSSRRHAIFRPGTYALIAAVKLPVEDDVLVDNLSTSPMSLLSSLAEVATRRCFM